jgi:hypothetical protein
MTLNDNEDGRTIINPYITLYSPRRDWVALNTHTFRNAQSDLILPDDEEKLRQCYEKKLQVYQAVATVGRFNPIMNTVQHISADDNTIALVPLGFLLEDIVRKQFPKTYAFFKAQEKD